jgi:hypothetical protein
MMGKITVQLGSKIIYDPGVIVYHKVHEYRQGIGYMMKRGYFEGMSKAHIEGMYKGRDGGNKALVAPSLNFAFQCVGTNTHLTRQTRINMGPDRKFI